MARGVGRIARESKYCRNGVWKREGKRGQVRATVFRGEKENEKENEKEGRRKTRRRQMREKREREKKKETKNPPQLVKGLRSVRLSYTPLVLPST